MENEKGAEPSSVDERLAELNRQWQSRFDKLLKEKKQVEEELNSKQAVDQERRKESDYMDRKERIFNAALDRGLDPKFALELLLGEDDDARLDGLAKSIQAGVDRGVDAEVERRFKNAPKPAAGLAPYVPRWEEISRMPEEQLQALGPDAIAAASRQAGHESRTLRARIAQRLGGSGRLADGGGTV